MSAQQSFTLISSPLQGYTDYRFRNAFETCFGGIDLWVTPYLRFDKAGVMPNAFLRDVNPENKGSLQVVPQVLTRQADEFLAAIGYVRSLGYSEINWNLGCPYPMVAKRGLGSGLLAEPEFIGEILEKLKNETDIEISVKMRLGYDNSDEIYGVLEVLNRFNIKSIAIHPRTGKQLYKGDADVDAFKKCAAETHHKLIYNGDITTVERFNLLAAELPRIDTWMIGRGMIADPFLPQMIRANQTQLPNHWKASFENFHEILLQSYAESLSGPGHLLAKMQSFWDYFSLMFDDHKKELKTIKKTKSLDAYKIAVSSLF
jgi:tRNA-dihydrouridine synthase B